jgi:Asp-tRNA(Asn)/Glu-tRNA(Gln) amidotransferase A subunit family amidase
MGRNVADTAILLDAMTATDSRDPLAGPLDPQGYAQIAPTDLASLKLAHSEDLGFAPVARSIRETFRARLPSMMSPFRSEENTAPDMTDADEIFEVIRAVNFVAAHRERYEADPASLGPNTRANVEQGMAMSLGEVARAHSQQTRLYRKAQAFFKEFDVLITPAAAVQPFPWSQLYVDRIDGQELRTYFHWLALAYGLTLLGHPVAVIPCGRDAQDLPFGIQICGPRHGDRLVLGVAHALEGLFAGDPTTTRPLPDLARLAR